MNIRGKVSKEIVLDGDLIVAQYWLYQVLDLDMIEGRQVQVSGARHTWHEAMRAACYSVKHWRNPRARMH